jgi:hypothetical protein
MAVATNKQKAHQRRRQQDRRNSASPLLEIMPKLSVLAAALDAMRRLGSLKPLRKKSPSGWSLDLSRSVASPCQKTKNPIESEN